MARPATAAVRLLTGEREPVRLATTANITLSGLQTIDGVLTEVGDRVLVKNQADKRENGIYTASAGAWYRAADARTSRTMQKGTTVHVQQGTVAATHVYSFQTFEPVVDADDIDLAFVQSDDTMGAINDAVAVGVATVTESGGEIIDQAEAARDAAEAAAAGVNLPSLTLGDKTKQLFAKADGSGSTYLSPGFVHASLFGVLPSSGAKDAEVSAAISAAATIGEALFIPAGTYQFTKQVDFSQLLDSVSKIALGGDVYLDFSGATDPLQFPDHCFVKMDAGPLTQFAELAVTADELDRKFTLQTPSLSPQLRDVLTLWNPDNGSYNGVKSYYRAGEFVRVARYDGGTKDVTIAGGLLDTYVAGSIYIYKHPAKKMNITGGRLFIRESLNAGFEDFNSFMATRMADSDFSAIVPLDPAHSGHLYNQCLGLHGTGYHIDQSRAVGSDNYGVVFANCQDCDLNGYFSALKHGATAGGTDETGSVVNSNIRVNGTLIGLGPASPGSGIVAANFHGNVRNSRVGGYIGGGVSMGGNKNGLTPGTILTAREDGLGIAILLTEMVGHDFDFSGTYIKAAGDPGASAQATIAIGADTDGATNFTKHGGKINLDGCIIDAPQSTRPMTYQNRGYVGAEKVTISMKGATLNEVDSGVSPIIVVATASGRNIDRLELDGFSNLADADYSVAGVDAVRGWKAGGTVGVNPAIGNAAATAAVAFKAPRAPSVVVTPQALAAGGKPIKPYYANPTASGADVGYSSVDNTAFTTTDGAVVSWQAFLDE